MEEVGGGWVVDKRKILRGGGKNKGKLIPTLPSASYALSSNESMERSDDTVDSAMELVQDAGKKGGAGEIVWRTSLWKVQKTCHVTRPPSKPNPRSPLFLVVDGSST